MTAADQLRALRRGTLANTLAWLAVMGLVGGGLYFVDQRDAERQREICGLIIVSDDSYRANPPSLAGGRSFAKALHDYRIKLGCPDTPIPTPAPVPATHT